MRPTGRRLPRLGQSLRALRPIAARQARGRRTSHRLHPWLLPLAPRLRAPRHHGPRRQHQVSDLLLCSPIGADTRVLRPLPLLGERRDGASCVRWRRHQQRARRRCLQLRAVHDCTLVDEREAHGGIREQGDLDLHGLRPSHLRPLRHPWRPSDAPSQGQHRQHAGGCAQPPAHAAFGLPLRRYHHRAGYPCQLRRGPLQLASGPGAASFVGNVLLGGTAVAYQLADVPGPRRARSHLLVGNDRQRPRERSPASFARSQRSRIPLLTRTYLSRPHVGRGSAAPLA
mmetsp:Transcript_16316/g.35404  ORF Transcript_16316/g.35404 Transcript_16316/m.35404 type:complete len:285 (-) Transcript_16316:665-1519(-)